MLCVSIAHWKAVLPASRQHSLQIASKQATQPADCLQACGVMTAAPCLLQASCRALLVTHSHLQHDTAAIRLNLGALAGPLVAPPSTISCDQATLEKLTPWIVTSPPRPAHGPHQAPSQPSLFRHQSDQPFVAFSYKRPAKKAQEPTVLQLTVAPIDVIYSQLCLLSLLDFLNAAWPAAGLDPLKVRASVSLREIVQEKLLGQQQRQMARRQQQHNMQRTKVQHHFSNQNAAQYGLDTADMLQLVCPYSHDSHASHAALHSSVRPPDCCGQVLS